MRDLQTRPVASTAIICLFLIIAIWGSAAIPTPDLLGAHVNLLLVFVATWAVMRSSGEMMLAAPPAALLAGLLGPGSLGAPLLTLLAPVGLATLAHHQQRRPSVLLLGLVVVVSTVWGLLVALATNLLDGSPSLDLGGIVRVVAGAVLINLIAAFVLYWPLRLTRKREPASRRSQLSLS